MIAHVKSPYIKKKRCYLTYTAVFAQFEFSDYEISTFIFSGSLQGKQRVLYSLLDAMQSVTSQAVVVGVSCRLVWCFQVSFICLVYYLQVCAYDEFLNQKKMEALLTLGL